MSCQWWEGLPETCGAWVDDHNEYCYLHQIKANDEVWKRIERITAEDRRAFKYLLERGHRERHD